MTARTREALDRAVPLATVAGRAGQAEVAHAVGAALALGVDVLDLQRHIGLAARRARAPELLEPVFPQLGAGRCPLLGRDAGDLGILPLLEVELDQLLREGRDRHQSSEPSDPGEHVGDSAQPARREPTLGLLLGFRVRGFGDAPQPTVARRAGPPSATEGLASEPQRRDRKAPVLDLDRGDDAAGRLVHDGDARDLRSRIDLDPRLVDDRILGPPVVPEDREGEAPEHRRTPLGQEDPGPRRRARIERLAVGVESEDLHGACL